MRVFHYLLICLLSLPAVAVNAHEFWINPSAYIYPSGARVDVVFSFGDDFERTDVGYYPSSSKSFMVHANVGSLNLMREAPVTPAARVNDIPDGLTIFTNERNEPREIFIYPTRERHTAFLENHGLSDKIDTSAATVPIAEKYNRFSKSLVAVGDGNGKDRLFGLEVELVAATNPYLPRDRETMSFDLYAFGQTLAAHQVEVYEKPLGGTDVTRRDYVTDENGRVKFAVKSGHEYLVNSVIYRAATGAVQYESLWASSTFAISPE